MDVAPRRGLAAALPRREEVHAALRHLDDAGLVPPDAGMFWEWSPQLVSVSSEMIRPRRNQGSVKESASM